MNYKVSHRFEESNVSFQRSLQYSIVGKINCSRICSSSMLRPGELAPLVAHLIEKCRPSVCPSPPYTYRVLLAHIAALKMKKILQINEELFLCNKTNFFKKLISFAAPWKLYIILPKKIEHFFHILVHCAAYTHEQVTTTTTVERPLPFIHTQGYFSSVLLQQSVTIHLASSQRYIQCISTASSEKRLALIFSYYLCQLSLIPHWEKPRKTA